MSNTQRKSGDGFATGIILVLIGIFALCVSFFHIHIVWSQLIKLWPLLLIVIGVSLIPVNRWIRTGAIVLILICGVIGYQSLVKNHYEDSNTNVEIFNDEDWDFFDETVENQQDTIENESDFDENLQEFSEPYKSSIRYAEVELDYGAGELKIDSPTANLIYASNSSKVIRQGFNVRYDGSNEAEIKFTCEGSRKNDLKKQDNKFTMSLNTNPIWSFDFELGVCDIDFDFSNYKVSEIDMKCGVSSIDMKIGSLYENTKIDIETGVSNVTIRIPKLAGCRIECESPLSSKSFDGFEKVDKGVYEAGNYGAVSQNIVIEFEGAVSNINIIRY